MELFTEIRHLPGNGAFNSEVPVRLQLCISFGKMKNLTTHTHKEYSSNLKQYPAHSGYSMIISRTDYDLSIYPPEGLFCGFFKLVVSMEWLLHSLLEVGEFPWWAIPLYTVCKSFWEPSKWKALYKYTLPPAASRLSTGDAFASLMYIVFHLGHCFYFYDHKRNMHSMNNNVNCIHKDIYICVFLWFET